MKVVRISKLKANYNKLKLISSNLSKKEAKDNVRKLNKRNHRFYWYLVLPNRNYLEV